MADSLDIRRFGPFSTGDPVLYMGLGASVTNAPLSRFEQLFLGGITYVPVVLDNDPSRIVRYVPTDEVQEREV